ncbi:MAG: hypothetical protein M1469_11700 [Bacteroidetes bacterium]|nr:hypothetical protein [Bacteroidota bacterium]
MKNRKLVGVSLVLFLSLISVSAAGCSSFSLVRSYYVAFGRVIQVDEEGGFFGIKTDSGGRLYPVNLPVEFQQDGISVRVTYRIAEGPATQDWGTPIRIIDIRRF